MPILDIHSTTAATPAQMAAWQPLDRIDEPGGNVPATLDQLAGRHCARLLYAEGDSWFDKFTPLPLADSNLLSALRLPGHVGVVDVSQVGSTSRSMVSGRQRAQTEAMFKVLDFDAVLLSAGGNDLKDLFATLYRERSERARGLAVRSSARLLDNLAQPGPVDEYFDGVLDDIQQFIALRNAAGREGTRRAPLLLHGYDYLQPRPAGAALFAGGQAATEAWIYPELRRAGLSDQQMLLAAREVVDALNERLRQLVASLPDSAQVYMLDQRGLLQLAAPGSTGPSGDWMDEIHPTAAGFSKLAQRLWNPALARLLQMQA